jgi:hypothetical protein
VMKCSLPVSLQLVLAVVPHKELRPSESVKDVTISDSSFVRGISVIT